MNALEKLPPHEKPLAIQYAWSGYTGYGYFLPAIGLAFGLFLFIGGLSGWSNWFTFFGFLIAGGLGGFLVVAVQSNRTCERLAVLGDQFLRANYEDMFISSQTAARIFMISSLDVDTVADTFQIEEYATKTITGGPPPDPFTVERKVPPRFPEPKQVYLRTYRVTDKGIAFIPASLAIDKDGRGGSFIGQNPDVPFLDMYAVLTALAVNGQAAHTVQCAREISVSEVFFSEMINIEYKLNDGEPGPMTVTTRDNRLLALPALPELAKLWRERIIDSKRNQDYRQAELAPSVPSQANMKICPMCAEEIKAAAKICRFCRHEFDAIQE